MNSKLKSLLYKVIGVLICLYLLSKVIIVVKASIYFVAIVVIILLVLSVSFFGKD